MWSCDSMEALELVEARFEAPLSLEVGRLQTILYLIIWLDELGFYHFCSLQILVDNDVQGDDDVL